MYVDDKLMVEGHTLSIRDIFNVLKVDAEFIWLDEDDPLLRHNNHTCPKEFPSKSERYNEHED